MRVGVPEWIYCGVFCTSRETPERTMNLALCMKACKVAKFFFRMTVLLRPFVALVIQAKLYERSCAVPCESFLAWAALAIFRVVLGEFARATLLGYVKFGFDRAQQGAIQSLNHLETLAQQYAEGNQVTFVLAQPGTLIPRDTILLAYSEHLEVER